MARHERPSGEGDKKGSDNILKIIPEDQLMDWRALERKEPWVIPGFEIVTPL